MTGPIRGAATGPARADAATASSGTSSGATKDAKLRNAARQLEGVFTQQLFKAMRETVPEDEGAVGGSGAQDMFTGLLDEHLASDPRAASTHGIGEAIYQHLVRTRGAHAASGTPDGAPAVTPPGGAASLRKTR